MKPRLPWILFAISLALNLFFGAGVIYSKLEAERRNMAPEKRIAELAEQLQLSEADAGHEPPPLRGPTAP